MRILKKVGLWLMTIVLMFICAVVVFMYTSPQFGASPTGEDLKRISLSENYENDQFVNLIETVMDQSFDNTIGMIKEGFTSKNTSPEAPIPTKFDQKPGAPIDSLWRVTWYGHSAILLEKDGKRIFLDPMLGNSASPVPIFGTRFENTPAFDLESFKYVDFVVFSHDHYDHLDYATVKSIKDKVGHFFTPLGLGSHLQEWGVPSDKITELDWWENQKVEGFTFTAAPARHFSGRGVSDRNKTLWASWVIASSDSSQVYFSGDGGYGPHFKTIGDKFGQFDFAMMECGQYNTRWEAIHMMPEQTVQASLDLNAKTMMPIHWGGFSLSPHAWTDPAERVLKAASKAALETTTPEIGIAFYPQIQIPKTTWWRTIN